MELFHFGPVQKPETEPKAETVVPMIFTKTEPIEWRVIHLLLTIIFMTISSIHPPPPLLVFMLLSRQLSL